ncbi:hypothetical protein KIN20_026311 [Parelaphostrongylus tenuis]|uniref:Uncharacterized protein n=1 Tax=Parelaphostrongylus tenuis TaxID=148309 RepID=A0AAD5NCJ0_PARTN|nr:hypothetical protein KIN20_026311 [Parelaphostrongylus tenuis]
MGASVTRTLSDKYYHHESGTQDVRSNYTKEYSQYWKQTPMKKIRTSSSRRTNMAIVIRTTFLRQITQHRIQDSSQHSNNGIEQ